MTRIELVTSFLPTIWLIALYIARISLEKMVSYGVNKTSASQVAYFNSSPIMN